MGTSSSYIIEKDKIANNIAQLRHYVGNRTIYAVLKSDGYGLGCLEMAILCFENGLRHFAVCNRKDAETVAAAVPVEELLLLSSADSADIPKLADLGVTFTVTSEKDLQFLEYYHARVHVKVDTGMGRRGFSMAETEDIIRLYRKYPGVCFAGIYTHFSDGTNRRTTQLQFSRFQSVLKALEQKGIQPGIRHCCASTSFSMDVNMLLDGVRIGSAFLGRFKNAEEKGFLRTGFCCARIECVRQVQKGTTIGYGSIFRAKKTMRIAICPVGTHNGFAIAAQIGKADLIKRIWILIQKTRNMLTNRCFPGAVIHGMWCPVIGRICSEAVMLDVSDVVCNPGDIAVLDINPLYLYNVPIEFV